MATIFQEFGYQQRDELQFPAKKLRALWFSPPQDQPDLPRIFISELKVCRSFGKAIGNGFALTWSMFAQAFGSKLESSTLSC